jgi:alkane 1-monooxygenase
MFRDLKYLIAYVAPLSAYAAVLWQGTWSFATVVVAFVMIPLAEQIGSGTTRNLSPEEETKKEASPLFDLLLYLNLPLLLGLLWLYFSAVQQGGLEIRELLGMTLSTGIVVGSIGINVAHELGHRSKRYEQFLAKVLLTTALYTHFIIEHNRGHHLWVATPEDPASARLRENLYRFWWRSVSGTYRKAWQLEAGRLRREGKPAFSAANEMIWFEMAKALYLLAVWMLFGTTALLAAIIVAVLGVLLLETINYIEHYGLTRQLLPSGHYERVLPRHSWNSNHVLGRIFLYELTRHSDHHYKSTRKYQVLRHFDESPQLPHGYPVSILMALVPPLWFAAMDDRVREIQAIPQT